MVTLPLPSRALRRLLPLALAVVLPVALVAQAQSPLPKTTHRAAGFEIEVIGDLQGFQLDFRTRPAGDGVEIATLKLTHPTPKAPPRFTLKWAVPSHDIAGHWTTSRYVNKTVRPDWAGSRLTPSMFAREAPVNTLFGSANQNVLTFAVSDALNTILSGSGVREEDGLIYNEIVFFTERHNDITEYTAEVRLDRRDVPYWTALKDVGEWWARQPGYEPASVPPDARLPMYSTWYNYHQSLDAATLLKEVEIAKKMGYESIIVDDGWQTMDTGRGYAYTGDWEPERIPDMKGFVAGCHERGIKVLLWYAVPFVGKHAKVVDRFKDKSLRFDERLGAYVLDPRYPEVRQYLIDIYKKAIVDWNIDGFKLDFIERFTADANTVLEAKDGRDYASVNEATDRMMTDILLELKKIRPDVMIEYRQPYIGPLIRKYGNMFRAGDCPNSYLANKVKTTDLRLLTGDTAVHADMIMWHYGEPVELAAFQFVNILFSVPQVSVRLQDIPKDHFDMVQFYTRYWNENRPVLLDGEFEAHFPAANYPILIGHAGGKQIVALYADMFVNLDRKRPTQQIDIVNGKNSEKVIVSVDEALGRYRYQIRDCQGRVVKSDEVTLNPGVHSFTVPVSGLIQFERVQ